VSDRSNWILGLDAESSTMSKIACIIYYEDMLKSWVLLVEATKGVIYKEATSEDPKIVESSTKIKQKEQKKITKGSQIIIDSKFKFTVTVVNCGVL
jgi:hypothetical protein